MVEPTSKHAETEFQMQLSRREMLGRAGALAVAAMPLTSFAQTALAQTSVGQDSLSQIALRNGLMFGASIDRAAIDIPEYGALYTSQTSIVTTDVAMKFDYVRPTAQAFDTREADAIMAFAAARKLAVRGHTLVWNDNAPDWVRGLNAQEIQKVFDDHIERMASRYAGRLHSWDVVNEPFWPGHGKQGGYRNGPWLAAMGPDYVARAFRRVRAVDPKAKLVLNEAHCEIADSWGAEIRPRLLTLIDSLQQKGVPLDAIGLQAHLQPQKPYSDAAFGEFVGEIGKRKLDVYITELDVNDESFPAEPGARDAAVADRYGKFLDAVLAVPAVKSVQTWQLADKFSWYREFAKGGRQVRPLPYDALMQPKAARAAIAAALGRAPRRTPA